MLDASESPAASEAMGGTDRPTWAPPGVDLDRPSPARIYDYMLGGSHHFAIDRQMAEMVLAAAPQIRPTAHANRAFLRRAVEFMVGSGIRQFLDLGSGIPTVGNVHEVVHRHAPDGRVVYVDVDPVAVAHSLALVDGDARIAVVQADVRSPTVVLDNPAVRGKLDFSAPIGLLALGLLHFLPDSDEPQQMLAEFTAAMVSGSALAISQVSMPDEVTPEQEKMMAVYTATTPVRLRSRDEVGAFFEGFTVVEPGIVDQSAWRAEPGEVVDPADLVPSYAGVGVKP